jgi:alkylation response protein AidB-like acyl-CoA dehydrogenase
VTRARKTPGGSIRFRFDRAPPPAAVQTIYAGTNEIMRQIIARRMGLGNR